MAREFAQPLASVRDGISREMDRDNIYMDSLGIVIREL